MDKSYLVLVEQSGNSFAAHVPDLPTIVVVGETFEEVRQLATEAIEIYLEETKLQGGILPRPVTTAFDSGVRISAGS